jgi:hypothetical protein
LRRQGFATLLVEIASLGGGQSVKHRARRSHGSAGHGYLPRVECRLST